MTVISVIVGSTREGRFSEKPAKWILQHLKKREGVDARLLDLRDFPMPFFDQPATPATPGRPPYKNEVVQRWTAAIAQSDGFVFVTPEYNYGSSAVLKNAIDWVYPEWNRKAAGFVSYGSAMGARSVQQLRLTAIEIQLARLDLLEQPLLEHLNFSESLRARRIHDEVRVSRGHAPGKEPNQPARFQVRFDERCTRQGDAEAGDSRRKEQILIAVTRSLTGIAIVQADRFEPDRPRLSLIVQEWHFQEVAGYTRQLTTSKRGAAHRNQLFVMEFDRYEPGPLPGPNRTAMSTRSRVKSVSDRVARIFTWMSG
jgi:NAD(P)H-dependent FMN reductase